MVANLQKPRYVYFKDRVCPWEEAVFHISSEAVLRGLNVFEGLKGYWQPDGGFRIVELQRHFDRLGQSARILHIPFDTDYRAFESATHELVRLLYEEDRNMWIRATLYGDEGHWGEDSTSCLVLTAYHTAKGPQDPVDTGVTPWRRGNDLALPYRVKTSTNYQVARLVRIENRHRGLQEMVLLNDAGRVAEGLGSAILMVRDGKVITPPSWEGALESITVDIIEKLCDSERIEFQRRPIDRTELLIADELAFAGTLAEITLVRSIDSQPMPPPQVLPRLAKRYLDAVTGTHPHPSIASSRIPPGIE